MGCASSKQKRCRHCRAPCSPEHRSYSLHGRRPKRDDETSYHIVALTSSTLGSLKLDRYHHHEETLHHLCNGNGTEVVVNGTKEEFVVEINEAKAWSNMIDEKITKIVPRTPITTPPGEPEIINTWEMMEGLEEVSPFRSPNHVRSFSFDVVKNPTPIHAQEHVERPKSRFQELVPAKPMWLQMANDDKEFVSDFDQEVISTFKKSLEDLSPSHPFHINNAESTKQSNLSVCQNPTPIHVQEHVERPKSRFQESVPAKPMWLQMANDDKGFVSDFDQEVISTFKKSLEDLSPSHPFHINNAESTKQSNLSVCQNPTPIHVQEHVERPKSRFQDDSPKPMWLQMANDDVDDPNPNGFASDFDQESISTFKKPVESTKQSKLTVCRKEKVVLYFTSLRGVRKTYEDCCDVRVILKGIGVRIDERDVSMHSGFKEELKELLGDGFYRGGLPRVFIGRDYLGGAEEVRRMHDEGKLERALEGCEMEENGVCQACGDVRFVTCETCSGSCKIYYEDEEYEDEVDEEIRDHGGSEEGEFGFQRCPDCNENGLIRCPICCD